MVRIFFYFDLPVYSAPNRVNKKEMNQGGKHLMNPFEKNRRDTKQKGNRDHPEQYPTDEDSLFDTFISQRTVDSIPVEDQTIDQQDEKKRDGSSKNSSSSEKKYKPES
ncbi:MAG: hypothetical protein K0R67_1564 [Paenibacillus sp.]|jgi:hypothetical protein|nr:hypothetical protein [Paenibacillus sp.]